MPENPRKQGVWPFGARPPVLSGYSRRFRDLLNGYQETVMSRNLRYKLLELLLDKKLYNETWYYYLTGEWRASYPKELKRMQVFLSSQRKFYSLLPSDPHCYECGIPMAGIGGSALRFMGSTPSSFSPRLCSACEQSARHYEVGAEVELTMLFADVRDSTPLAESKGTMEFKEIIQRFYKATSNVLIAHNPWSTA